MLFKDLKLDDTLLEGMDAMGFKNPTPIQEQAIPIIQSGKDIIACAQTGTGKTGAYLLPVLSAIAKAQSQHISTLIIAPTRELAIQIDQQVEALGYFMGISSIAIYGGGTGAEWDQQRKALRMGADIIIATPGRLIALMASGEVKFNQVKYLILDEADRMLDMGFYDDIVKIINSLPAKRQTLLFSATMPPKIRKLAEKILTAPAEVNIAISKPAEGITQQLYLAKPDQKVELLKILLQNTTSKSTIIFCSTKDNVKALERELLRLKIAVKAFHSGLEQSTREEIMLAFKNKQVTTLIGTDILSRGIDVEGIELVVNFDLPPDAEDYVHRIGRTARADTTGTAITFVSEETFGKLLSLEKFLGKRIPLLELPEQFEDRLVYEELLQKKSRPRSQNRFSRKSRFTGKKPNTTA